MKCGDLLGHNKMWQWTAYWKQTSFRDVFLAL